MSALEQAIAAVGGKQTDLATALGLKSQAINQWVKGKRPVPAIHCPAIERAAGVRCEELRPDVTWTRNDRGEVTGFHTPLARQDDARRAPAAKAGGAAEAAGPVLS